MRLVPSRHSLPQLPPEERGAWSATSRGRMWSIFDPHPADVSLEDISAGLARSCRYSGQLRRDVEFYSVAEHSVVMTNWAIDNGLVYGWEEALAILSHDASEGFYGDMITPLKKQMPEFRQCENFAQSVILEALGLNRDDLDISPAEIKNIDMRIRLDERIALINEPASSLGIAMEWEGDETLTPLGVDIVGLLPRASQDAYLECFLDICERFEPRDDNLDVRDKFRAEAEAVLGLDQTCDAVPEVM